VLFSSGNRLGLLSAVLVLYVLPWAACTAIIFYLWRIVRWWRIGRGRA
jgi:hypothetical protein